MRGLIVGMVLALGATAPALAAGDGPLDRLLDGRTQVADSGACTYRCQSRYNSCSSNCRTAACRSSCSSRYSSCLTGCTTRN